MESSFVLGRIRGIEIGIHYSWLLVFALITVTLALSFFPQTVPGYTPAVYWAMGALAAVLLFASVLIHELSHSFVAQALGMGVHGITLFIFGGVSNVRGEARSGRDELLMAAAGPLSSFALGAFFGLLYIMAQGAAAPPFVALLGYLMMVNVLLALFNLIPGFPLDGGRVLRAVLWMVTENYRRATNIAAGLGQVVAYLFIFGGILIALSGNFISGVWLAFIGWFLDNAASASRRQAQVQAAFSNVRVQDVMTRQPVTTGPDTTVQDLVDDYILQRNIRAVLVVEDDRLLGLVTVSDVRRVPRSRWAETPIRTVMTPASVLVTARPTDNMESVVQQMVERDLNQVPVLADGRLQGLLTRSNLMHHLHLRDELGESKAAA